MNNKYLSVCLNRLRIIPNGISNVSVNEDTLQRQKTAFLAEMAGLGYRITNPDAFRNCTLDAYNLKIAELKTMKGGNVTHVPLFGNFPDSVPEYKELDIVKENLPQLHETDEEFLEAKATQRSRKEDTNTEWIDLTIVTPQEANDLINEWCTNNLYAKSSIKEVIRDDINWCLDTLNPMIDLDRISFKETKTLILKRLWNEGNIGNIRISNPTDLLRLFAEITNSDVSLSEKIRFPKFNRTQRRNILKLLNGCPNVIDGMNQYKGLWLEIGRYIHPGEYKAKYPKIYKVFDTLRNGKFRNYNSIVEKAITEKDIPKTIQLLKMRPGVFGRKLHQVLAINKKQVITVINGFNEVANELELKNLLTLESYFASINKDSQRAIINKRGKIVVINNDVNRITDTTISGIISSIQENIKLKIAEKESWEEEKVWIDPALHNYVLPLQERKMSEGLLNLARGTRIPVEIGKTIRFFIYWKDAHRTTDLDLSLCAFDKDMKFVGHVSYTKLKDGSITHSGDKRSASHGATEFIDIPLTKANIAEFKSLGYKYLTIQNLIYSGDKFVDLEDSIAGWQMRDETDSNYKSFDIKTVQNKLDIRGHGKFAFPVLLDLDTMELVYVDLYVQNPRTSGSLRRVEGCYNDIASITRQLARFNETKPNIGALAFYNAEARGAEIVEEIDEATITFGIKDCTYNAGNTEKILADLI